MCLLDHFVSTFQELQPLHLSANPITLPPKKKHACQPHPRLCHEQELVVHWAKRWKEKDETYSISNCFIENRFQLLKRQKQQRTINE